MDQKQKLEIKLADLAQKIRETEERLPAHSVKPQIMTELFELEDEYEAVLAQLKAIRVWWSLKGSLSCTELPGLRPGRFPRKRAGAARRSYPF